MRTSVRMTSGPKRVDERERVLAAVGDLDLVAVLLQERAEDEADVLFVVDDQDAAHRLYATFANESTTQNRLACNRGERW